VEKAAYFSSLIDVRQIAFDLCVAHPDLFDCNAFVSADVEAWYSTLHCVLTNLN